MVGYRGDAGRYATGVAQPVNIAGWKRWEPPSGRVQGGRRPLRDGSGATREYRWLGLGLVGAVAWLSTPCKGTHQRLAPGCGNQVHLIWPT